MPDFERIWRKYELDRVHGEEQRVVRAYYKGMDRARKEVAVIALIIGVLCVIGHL